MPRQSERTSSAPLGVPDAASAKRARRSSVTGDLGGIKRLDLDTETSGQEERRAWVFHPYSPIRVYWDQLLLALMTWTVIVLPLQFSDLVESGTEGNGVVILALDQVVNFVFICDVMLNFRTGYLDVQARTLVLEPKTICRKYVTTWFGADLLASMPFDVIYLTCGRQCESHVWTFKFLRVLRMCRILRLSRILSRLKMRFALNQAQSNAVQFGLTTLFVAHCAACTFYSIGSRDVADHPGQLTSGTWVRIADPTNIWTAGDACAKRHPDRSTARKALPDTQHSTCTPSCLRL